MMNTSTLTRSCLKVAHGYFPSLSYVNPPSGPVVDIFKVASEKLNLCYELVTPPDGLWGAQLPNGSWFGMLGMIERDEIDLSLGPFAPTPERVKVADFSIPILTCDHTILYPRPQIQPDLFGFVKPFNGMVWLGVLVSMLTVSVAAILPQFIALCCRDGTHGELYYIEDRFNNLWGLMVLLGQAVSFRISDAGRRIVVVLWMLVALIIATVYKSNLKAMLIVPKVEVPFDSLEEMVNQDKVPFMITKGSMSHSNFEAAFKEDPNSVMGKAWARYDIMSTDPLQYFRLAKTSHAATIIRLPALNFLGIDFSQTGKCNMAMARKGYLFASYSFAFRKNSSLIAPFDKIIIRLLETGIVDKFLRDDSQNATLCSQYPGSELSSELRPLALGDFYGVFCLYTIGVGGGTLVFVIEIIVYRVAMKGNSPVN